MNNTYRKFFKVLRAWWITLMLFAFIPMANAQTINSVSVSTPSGYPESTVVVTLDVSGFTAHATYNYYVVYNYANYDKLLQFTHNQGTNIVKTWPVTEGDGTIAITATVPKELYTYSDEEITILVVSANGAIDYMLTPYVPPGSTYPTGNPILLGTKSFANYNNVARVFDTAVELESPFYEFDASTNFNFTLRRLNPEPAIKNNIVVQYKKGTGTWTTIRTLNLNNAGGPGLYQNFSSGDTDWPAGIIGKDISIRITQTDGEGLSSGIDTWAVENVTFNNVVNEPAVTNPYTPVFGHFYVKNLIGGVPPTDNYEILAPGFSIASITPPAAGYYPGEVATYNILSDANVSFPDATIFEVYLTQDFGAGPVQEILLGTFPLTGGTGLPAATTNRDFTFITPFMPGTNWYLNVRADLRDYSVHQAIGPFTIEGVDLTATLNYTKTPAAQQFELDGQPYLFPGSTVHVDYELGAGQTINTTTYNVNVVLDYHNGDEWVELKSQAFSMTPASQTINAALPSTITAANIPLRLRLVNGTKKDLATADIKRWVDDFFGGNFDWLPYEINANGLSAPAGSTFGFQLFAVNNTAQGLVVEYKDDDQPLWTSIGTINSLATDNKYVSNYATTTNNYSIVPTGQLTVENPKFRIRWADGGPLGLNKGILRGFRYQEPQVINVVSNGQSVRVLYPHLTMSPNIVDLYEFADDEASVSITVDYSKWKIPAAAQVAVVMLEAGDNPMVDPYLYLGSKAAGATDGEDFQTFTIAYSKIEEVFGELPQLPDPAMEFDVWILLTDKTATAPIIFKTEQISVGWKDGYNAQPQMITEAINLTGLPTPLFLSYDYTVTTVPNPLNDLTRPVLEYTTDEGMNWTKIDQHDFNTMLPILDAWKSSQTRFRWVQPIQLGVWNVSNVKILSGADNLVVYQYGMTGIPQEIEMALAAEIIVPPVNPCLGFTSATIDAYSFDTDETTVNTGEEFDIEWTFNGPAAKAKTITDQELTAYDKYVLGTNDMEFNLAFESTKKITQFVMTFPTGVVPTAADVINVDGNTLTPTISGTARTVTYASAAGAVVGIMDIDFNVTFTVPTTASDTIVVAFTITDADGTKNGVCKIAPSLAFPEGTVFKFWIWNGAWVQIGEGVDVGEFKATVPVGTPTAAYDVYVNATFDTVDEDEDPVTCGPSARVMVYENLFVISDQTPEVYQIELTEVNFIDPDEDYYWGKEVDVKFDTFGPWQDFEDLRFEAALLQYDYVLAGIPNVLLNEGFEDVAFPPVGWNLYNVDGGGTQWTRGTTNVYSGTGCALHNFSYASPDQDGWLVTPAISVPASGMSLLSFWSYNTWAADYDKNSVLISTGSSNPASGDFVEVWSPASVASAQVQTSLSLNAYAGQTIYIAFRYQGYGAHGWYLDNVKVENSPFIKTIIDYYTLGTLPHVSGTNSYTETFDLPSFEDLEDTDFDLDIDGTTFEVEIFAYQGEEDEKLVFGREISSITDFYLLSGTTNVTTPVTFNVPNVLRYAITNKIPLAGLDEQDVYLQFTYSAMGITAPNFKTIPTLQVTLDNGLTYVDIEVEGSAFEEQARLDASAINKVYRYKIADEYMSNETRFRWYQEVPDGVWSINNISVTLITNEVPVDNYFINAPAYTITIKEELIPGFCDQFDPASLAAYTWGVEEVDEVTGFEAAVKTGEDFAYTFEFDATSGLDQLPDETEFMFFINKFASTFKKKDASNSTQRAFIGKFDDVIEHERFSGNATTFAPKEDEVAAEWIRWDDGTPNWIYNLSSFSEAVHLSRFTPADIDKYVEFAVTRVATYIYQLPGTAEVVIWQGPNASNLVEVYSQFFTPVADDWNLIVLNDPYTFNREEELWIGIRLKGANISRVVTADAVLTNDGKGNLLFLDGGLYSVSSGDFNIATYVEPALITINKDGIPVTLGDAPFTGFVPTNVPTGIYEVMAQAKLPEDEDGNACNFGFRVLKNDLLIINDETNPGDPYHLTLDALYNHDPEAEELGDPVFEFIVGQKLDVQYSTYGPWPADINFGAVVGDTFLDLSQETGQEVIMSGVQMPYYPMNNEITYIVPNSPGIYDYADNTWTELGWTEFDVVGYGLVTNVNIQFDWLSDDYPDEGSFWMRSPAGTVTMIDDWISNGTFSYDLSAFDGEDMYGKWRLWIEDSWGDGGHQATNIEVTFEYQLAFNIYAYFGDELILSDNTMRFDMNSLNLVGYNDVNNRFDQEGTRFAATHVLDLSEYDNSVAKMWFDYTDINVTQSAATLPQFQVSTNGGTSFSTLFVLDENKQYSANIASYLTANTVFRWYQPANFGQGFDMWNVSNIVVTIGDDNVVFRSNPIAVTQIIPTLAGDYSFAILEDEDGLEPAIYAGDNFDFEWDVVLNGDSYPEGTLFRIELHDIFGNLLFDNVTGQEVVIYEGTETGEFTAAAPKVDRGTYLVHVTASYEGFVYDEDYVGIINIFNPVIRTSIVGLDIPYAGGNANFKGTLESNLSQTLNNTYWYNLILDNGGDEWLLAAQQGGAATFNNVNLLPKYLNGPQIFKIRASVGGPLGEVGEIIPNRNTNTWLSDFNTFGYADGDKVIKKYDTEDIGIDFSDYEFMSFDIKFSENIADLTENQYLVLEYSVDGGKTYATIHSYPDARFNDESYFNGDWFEERNLPIPVEAQQDGAILRFRIQELKGTVDLVDIELIAKWDIQYAPYYALNSIINIAKQRVEITGFDAISYLACDNVDVEIFYNIRGSFGDDVEYFLYANGTDTEFMPMLGTEGSGSFIFNVDESFDALQFRIDAEDATFDDEWGTIYVDGDESDLIAIEIVPEIIDAAGDPLISAMNDYSCDIAERFLLVNFPQDYFVYQVRNAITHEPLSEEVLFDPEMDMLNEDLVLPISIGIVDSRIIVEVVVTAQSKDGSLVCETMVLNEQVVFDVRNLAIQYLWDNNNIGGVWMNVPEDAGDMIICYGSNDLFLRIWDYSMDNGNGGVVNANIKWYRDVEMIAPVGATGMINSFPLTGGYFAVITSEFCDVWTSQVVDVVVEDAPVKPIIEFIGSQELCEGEHATLQIAADYEFYRWYRNGWLIEGSNTNWIDIYQSGYYEVEVSNYPFDPFVPVCTQFAEGLSVNLNIHYKPYIPDFYIVDNTLCEPMPAQIVVSSWEDNVWYQAYILETGEPTGAAKLGYQGNLVLETDVLDHEVFLGVMAWRMGVETCDPVYSTQVYEVAVYNLTIEVSGNVLIATLAPYDNRVVSYQWYKDNVAIQNNGTGRTLTVYDEASYSVKVRTSDGCILTATLAKADEDTTPDVVPSSMTVSLYPNPVQDNLTLKLDGNYLGNIQVRIINLAGVVIYDLNAEKAAVEFEQVISVDNLTQGVYIIQITGGEYSEVKRFIKK